MIQILLLAISFIHTALAAPQCGDDKKNTPIYQSYEACNKARMASLVGQVAQPPACSSTIPESKDPNALLTSACKDPAAFACSHHDGLIFNSKCELWLDDPKDIENAPVYVSENCSFKAKEKSFLTVHHSECSAASGKLSVSGCNSFLKTKYTKKINEMERSFFYTPERSAKVQAMFQKVIAVYQKKINDSKTISAEMKPLLLKNISETKLQIPPPPEDPPQCANSGPTGPDSGIYNDSQGHIVFCIGAVALLDNANEFDIIHTLAHELSHSIDPCALELRAFQNDTANPAVGNSKLGFSTYSHLVSCLRGGKGEQSCDQSILHCNTAKGTSERVAELVDHASHGQKLEDGEKKMIADLIGDEVKATPDCPWGKSDPNYHFEDLSAYRKDAEPVNQIGEAFADFMGAEVVGQIIKDSPSPLSKLDQADALTSIGSDYSRLHGGCAVKENTNDPHPPGIIRMDRVIMGSDAFRSGLGCQAGPPNTALANLTCEGI